MRDLLDNEQRDQVELFAIGKELIDGLLSGLVGDTIAAELAGRKGGEVVPLKRGA